jgi:molecular chaperone DnaK
VGDLNGRVTNKLFSPVIPRNTALPATRSEIYYTGYDGQDAARIHVLQGEHEDVNFNESVGEFMLEGLDEQAEEGSEILVRFDLNLDGILKVTAVERDTGLEKQLQIDNAITRFRASSHEEAKAKLAEVFRDDLAGGDTSSAEDVAANGEGTADSLSRQATELVAKARRLISKAATEDADEMRELIDGIQQAESSRDRDSLRDLTERLEDLLFYVEDV